jgi:hypothetical protein
VVPHLDDISLRCDNNFLQQKQTSAAEWPVDCCISEARVVCAMSLACYSEDRCACCTMAWRSLSLVAVDARIDALAHDGSEEAVASLARRRLSLVASLGLYDSNH